jgi:hypothetical protein
MRTILSANSHHRTLRISAIPQDLACRLAPEPSELEPFYDKAEYDIGADGQGRKSSGRRSTAAILRRRASGNIRCRH